MAQGPRIVLVDDDDAYRRLLEHRIQRVAPTAEILSFANGLEALTYLLNQEADVVLTDFHMPEMDGLQLTSHVRSAGYDMPVIVISGDEVEAQALGMGATAFVSKSESVTAVLETLGALGIFAPSGAA